VTKDRCKPNHPQAKDYYNRGVKFLFSSFEEFIAEIGTMEATRQKRGLAPATKLVLDRIDHDGNYEPGNVRWATRKERNLNKRTVRNIQAQNDSLQEILDRRNEFIADWILASFLQKLHASPR